MTCRQQVLLYEPPSPWKPTCSPYAERIVLLVSCGARVLAWASPDTLASSSSSESGCSSGVSSCWRVLFRFFPMLSAFLSKKSEPGPGLCESQRSLSHQQQALFIPPLPELTGETPIKGQSAFAGVLEVQYTSPKWAYN